MPSPQHVQQDHLQKAFARMFRTAPQCVAHAPGRINLIGEHTDYNGGWVLPAPLPKFAYVAASRRADRLVHVTSANIEGPSAVATFDLDRLAPTRGWVDYVQGVCHALKRYGGAPSGMNVCASSEVPLGGGLSSSAALEIAFARALRLLFELPLSDLDLAHLGHVSEHDFVGAQVGMMDQMAASVGRLGSLLSLNTATLEYTHLPWPAQWELAVVHSGLHHDHAAGEYNARRQSCIEAAQALHVETLCSLEQSALPRIEALPDVLRQRARHVVAENARVHRTVGALLSGDEQALKALLYASHVSLRDDYQVSVPALDALVDAAMTHTTCFGARMTGGGFGGCMIMVAQKGQGAALMRNVLQACKETAPQASAIFCGRLEADH